MQVSQIGLLLGGQAVEAVVALALVAQAVLAVAPEDAEGRQAQHDDLHRQVDVVPDVVERRVVAQVRPRRQNAADRAQADDVAGRHGAHVRACVVVDCPREEAWSAGEGADLQEERKGLAGVVWVGGGEEDE